MPAPGTVWGSGVWANPVWRAGVWADIPIINTTPNARFTVSGTGLARTFDSSLSSDDVGIASRAWLFGDGTSAGDLVAPTHAYAVSGTYVVVLVITNLGGWTDTFATDVTVYVPTSSTSDAAREASEVGICNMALAHLGISTTIAALTDPTQSARACARFYAQCRDAVLRDFPWPFATSIQLLGLVQNNPNTEWLYSYRYPADCLMARRIPDGVSRIATPASLVVFREGADANGKLIFTDQADAELEYTVRLADPTLFPPDFVEALAYRIAASIAPQVTGGDPFKLGARAMQLYTYTLEVASLNAANESQPDQPPDSPSIMARN